MRHEIPSSEQVADLLQGFRQIELAAISEQSGVSFPALVKIRQRTTRNPGLDTVRKIYGTQVVSRRLLLQKRILRASESTRHEPIEQPSLVRGK